MKCLGSHDDLNKFKCGNEYKPGDYVGNCFVPAPIFTCGIVSAAHF